MIIIRLVVPLMVVALLAASGASIAPKRAVITTAGYGDVTLGHRVPAGSALVKWDPKACESYETGTPGQVRTHKLFEGRWIPSNASKSGGSEFIVQTANDKKSGVVITLLFFSARIKTKSGAHVGMPVGKLHNLFPRATIKHAKYSDLYIVQDGAGRVVFEAATATGAKQLDAPWADGVVAGIYVIPAGERAYAFDGDSDPVSSCNR